MVLGRSCFGRLENQKHRPTLEDDEKEEASEEEEEEAAVVVVATRVTAAAAAVAAALAAAAEGEGIPTEVVVVVLSVEFNTCV